MAKISGYLKDGAGQAVAECIIILSALKTSNQVIEQIESYTTTKDGFYEINALTGQYKVTLTIAGHPPKKVGVITVYTDSANGTLNDFLANGITNDDITPLLLSQLIEERKQAQDAALSAKSSATHASSALANVVKKTGDTMINGLKILSNTNSSIEIGNAEGSDSYIINRLTDGKFAHRIKGTNGYLNRLIFEPTKNTWNFVNSYLTIDNNLVLKQGDYGLFLSVQKVIEITSNKQLGSFVSGERQLVKDATGTYLPSKNPCYLVKLASRDNSYGGAFLLTEYFETGKTFIGKQLSASSTVKWQEFITTENSTVDSNGFYKKASPIFRLFGDDNITEVEGFKLAGCGLVNSEADGVIAKRIDVGHYEIHGSLGFAKEGWYITLPEDANGNKKIFAEYSTDDNNIITVKTFTRKFDIELCEVVSGEPIDITAERWIDLRLDMPVNEVIDETDL